MENIITNTSTNETKEALKIRLTDHVPFNATAETVITSTNALAKCINDVFSQVFSDYYGCSLRVQLNPQTQGYIIIPRLHFTVQKKYDDDKIYAFRPLGANKNGDSMVGRVQRLSQSASSGTKVLITDDAKSALGEFLITPAIKANNFDWSSAYGTTSTDSDTYINVFKLDLLKLVNMIYGDTDSTGSKLYYQITPTGLIGNQYKSAENWAIQILRLNHTNESAAAELLGFNIPSQASMPNIITETSK